MHRVCTDSYLVEPWLTGATCAGKGKEKIDETLVGELVGRCVHGRWPD